MKWFDRRLQSWRIHMAVPYLPPGGRVLDIGCHQGELFDSLQDRLGFGVGIDPLTLPRAAPRYVLLRTLFQGRLPLAGNSLDAVVMLATLEHIQDPAGLASECYRVLRPSGRVVITVPDVKVDRVVDLLVRLRIVDGMALEQHHGYRPKDTPAIFCAPGLRLVRARPFQLGLNYLYVFQKP